MASRRRPPAPPRRPASLPPIEENADAAERTMISEVPVFEDEAPTPLPQVQVLTPPRGLPAAPSRPVPRAPSTLSRPAAAPAKAPRTTKAPATRAAKTPAPQPAKASAPRAAKTPAPQPAKASAPRASKVAAPQPATPRTLPAKSAAPRPAAPRAKLGAAPIPEADTDPKAGAAPRREATFIGLPVGLGAAPAAAPPPAAPRSKPAAPAPGLVLPNPYASASKPAAAPPSAPSSAPAATPVAVASPKVADSTRPPLSFDATTPAEPKVDLHILPASTAGAGLNQWMVGGAAAAVALVVGAFVFGGSEPESVPPDALAISQAKNAKQVARPPASVRVAEAPKHPSSAVMRAASSKKKGPRIARRQGARPMWSSARIAALQAPDAEPPEFGGAEREEVNHRRSYLKDEQSPGVPMLMIFTHPPGMTIEVAGNLFGRTPLIRPLYGDVPTLDVKLTGVGFKEQRITLRPDKERNLRFNAVMEPIDKPKPAP